MVARSTRSASEKIVILPEADTFLISPVVLLHPENLELPLNFVSVMYTSRHIHFCIFTSG